MKKVIFIAMLLVFAAAFAAFAEPMPGGTRLVFTTGGAQGTYYGFGGVLAGKVGEKTSTKVTVIASGGSKANIEAMSDGDAQLGFTQSDVGAYAFKGTRLFENEKISDFSTVANLYMEQVQIVTLNPEIKTVADLKGKNVSIGAAGSGVFFNAVDVLKVYGLDVEKDIKPTYQSFGDSVEALQDGKIDAAFIVAGAPTTAVTSLAATKKVYLVSLDDEHIVSLLAESPYYSKNVISKNTYGTEDDAITVAVGAVVIARDDVSEADVYNFLYGVFENKDEITAAHAKGAELKLDFAASYTAVPYHPGAVKYYAEKGMKVSGKIVGD
ncbi:MAG: TAXI family TRAP transporter solute-binding subunit [Synergistaceae bacterium]|nr:TAXI family TRAP transporter solute-binding subunit [Synergistaceae bacterium]